VDANAFSSACDPQRTDHSWGYGDLKPANFLFVNGALKLTDFGIANAISNDTTNIERESQVGGSEFHVPRSHPRKQWTTNNSSGQDESWKSK
jgi:serine/threonine protein kinase